MESGWKCLLCDARPRDVSRLQQHILIHLGIQPDSANVKNCFSNNDGGLSWDKSLKRSRVHGGDPRSEPEIGGSDLVRQARHSNATNTTYSQPRQPAVLQTSINPQLAPMTRTHNLKKEPISITNKRIPTHTPCTNNIVKQELLHSGYQFILPRPGPLPSAYSMKNTTITNGKMMPVRLCDQMIKVLVCNESVLIPSCPEGYAMFNPDLEQTKLYKGDETKEQTKLYKGDETEEQTKLYKGDKTEEQTKLYKGDETEEQTKLYKGDETKEQTKLYKRDKTDKCDVCDNAFNRATKGLKRYQTAPGKRKLRNYKCELCEIEFSHVHGLKFHVLTKHTELHKCNGNENKDNGLKL